MEVLVSPGLSLRQGDSGGWMGEIMTNPFTRPEKPRELSKAEIIILIKSGQPYFCAKCGQRLKYGPFFMGCMDCYSDSPRNLSGVLRIIQNKIVCDAVDVGDAFDISKHFCNRWDDPT